MRSIVNDASQSAADEADTRSSHSIFDSASQTPPLRMHSATGAWVKHSPPSRVGFIAANLTAFCRSKTVSKAVHAPPADGPYRKAGTDCVGVNLISADGTARVCVALS